MVGQPNILQQNGYDRRKTLEFSAHDVSGSPSGLMVDLFNTRARFSGNGAGLR
jgi:hypothetical protein